MGRPAVSLSPYAEAGGAAASSSASATPLNLLEQGIPDPIGLLIGRPVLDDGSSAA